MTIAVLAPGTPDFYSAVAQIIPVLVLVVIVEQRSERRLGPLANLAYFLLTVGAAALGEIVALRDLYRGHAYLQDQYVVVGTLVVLVLALVAPLGRTAIRELEANGTAVSKAIGWVLCLAVTWLIVVLAIVVYTQR